MLHRALKMAFWVCFDHLGKLLVVNGLCFVVLLAPIAAGWWALQSAPPVVAVAVLGAVGLAVFAVLLPVCATGLAAMMKELIETRDGSVRTFFSGVRRFWGRAVGLGVVLVALQGLFAVSAWFYPTRFGASVPLLGFGLSALALWAMVYTGLVALFAAPALVQKQGGVLATLRLSALLVLDNPLLSAGVVLALLPVAAACVAPPVLMFFSLAPVVAVVSSAYEMLSRKYAAVEAHGDAPGRARVAFGDEEDDYLNRGFRDLLFPWKG